MAIKSQEIVSAKRVGIWIRVSTEDQARGESPEHHEKRARYYVESRGWEVVEVYHLEAVSGKSVMDHPEAQRMLKDIRSKHITGLIFSKLARLARNARELLEFADIFDKEGADLVSLQESIDTSTPSGRLFYTMFAAMAQWEREEIADRVAASVPIRAKLGKPLGGKPSYGYQWKDKKLVPNPETAPIRRLIYELFLEHKRKKTVARLLNEAGHRTQNGALFSDATIGLLLRDSSAKGLHRTNYNKSRQGGKKNIFKPESDWVMTQVEPIVSEELWAQCNRVLTDQYRPHQHPRARRPVQLFGGLTWCTCGRKMYVRSRSPKYICEHCHNKIGLTDLEDVFYEQLKGFFLAPEEIARFLSGADETIREKTALLAALEGEQTKLKDEMDRIYRLYIDGEIPSQGFGARYRPLDDRSNQLDAEIPRLQAEIDFLKINYLSSDHVLAETRDLYTRWPTMDHAEKHKIIENITDKITIGPTEIDIELCFLPSLEHVTKEQSTLRGTWPFCYLKLKAVKPMVLACPETPETLGDHLWKRRVEMGLSRREVAEMFEVDASTIKFWEKNRHAPPARHLPKIVEFLGYVPTENKQHAISREP